MKIWNWTLAIGAITVPALAAGLLGAVPGMVGADIGKSTSQAGSALALGVPLALGVFAAQQFVLCARKEN